MISMQPAKDTLVEYIEVPKNRILDVKPTRVKKLIDSLEQIGRVLNPLLVTMRGPDDYRLVTGATRLAAVKQLGWHEVPIVVISGSDDEIKLVEAEENLGRFDLTEQERERLEHVRKMCRSNIDKAEAEARAYIEAHPKEIAEAKEIAQGSAEALKHRGTKKTAAGAKPKRKHRTTGGKRGRPEGGTAAIARKHGVKPATIRKRQQRKRGAKNVTKPDVTKKAPSVTCPKCGHEFEVKK